MTNRRTYYCATLPLQQCWPARYLIHHVSSAAPFRQNLHTGFVRRYRIRVGADAMVWGPILRVARTFNQVELP